MTEQKKLLKLIWSGDHFIHIYESSLFGDPCFECSPYCRKHVKRRLRQKAFHYLKKAKMTAKRIQERMIQRIEDDFIRSIAGRAWQDFNLAERQSQWEFMI